MSLSREATKEICDYVKEHSAILFGQKFRECRFISAVQAQTKSDKCETKFLTISKFRVFLLAGKQFSNLKVEKCFNVLALRQLHIITPEHALNIGWEERGRVSTLVFKTNNEKESTELACEFLSSLKHYFPDIRHSLTKFLSVSPSSLLAAFPLLPSSTPDLPCNNFRRSYVTYCDYNDLLYRDEVSWDVENIYFVHDIHEIRLDDFSHLPIKDQIAVIGCAQFSSYFTGIYAEAFKLTSEHVDAILSVVRRSHALKSLSLVGCGLLKDFASQLAAALQHNQTIPLESLNLSSNNLDDKKGIALLAVALPRIHTLKSLLLNDCGLSEKSIHHLASGLYTGFGVVDPPGNSGRFELRSLHLAGNSLKDDANELVNFVSLCNTLRTLDLSHTGLHIDRLWPALKLGGLQLEHLRLAGCAQSSKKSRDNLQLIVKELFSSMVNLKELNLAGTSIGSDILQNILTGISNNTCISDIRLNMDGIFDDKGCASIVEQHIVTCPIAELSLRDNSLEHDALKILPALMQLRSLKCLDLGGANFHGLKSNKKYNSTLSKVLRELGNLISCSESCLEELTLSDCRLGSVCMSVVLEPLASTNLKFLDVSGNELGNAGARFLSKALQLNNTLRRLSFDRNQIGVEGFAEIEHGMKLNHCLLFMTYPMNDAAAISDRAKILSILSNMEKYLERNKINVQLSDQCCQSALQSLINNCDKYNINASDENKIIFHNLIKSVAEVRKTEAVNVSFEDIIESFVHSIDKISVVNADLFMQKFRDVLTAKKIEIASESSESSARGFVWGESDEKVALTEDLRSAFKAYLTKSAWNYVSDRSDSLLSSPNTLKVRGAFSNFTIDNSVHAAIAERSGGMMAMMGGRRPNSVFHDSLVASLTSGENSIEGILLEAGPLGERAAPLTPLVHLAKNRPRPARQFKNKLNTPLKQSCGSIATDDSFDYINDSASKPERKSRQSSGADSSHHNNNNANLHNLSMESIEDGGGGRISPRSSGTPPPPLIPRRNKMFGVPPKLPPKPSAESSPTDLRHSANSVSSNSGGGSHNKHKVSPAKDE